MGESELVSLSQDNTVFAFDLYHQLKDTEGNLFFSPFSISVALAMTYAGARDETASQMARVLHFSQKDLHEAFLALQEKLWEAESAGGVQLKIANSLWPHVKYAFRAAFLDLALKYYGVSFTPVDYVSDAESARQTINQWVAEKTAQKIRELIPQGILDALTRLVLVNAIYFKGNWAAQFDAKLTQQEDFWTAQGQVKVPLMTRKGQYRYAETSDLQILELPYAGDRVSLLVLLPRAKDGLANLENQLTSDFLAKIIKSLRETDVTVYLPKFKVESDFTLNDVLSALGMPDAFDESKADFSGMDGTRELYVKYVLHKAFIEVNEEGSEAAAATAVVMALRAAPSKPLEFRADHPFLFFIRENQTGSILFAGRMTQP